MSVHNERGRSAKFTLTTATLAAAVAAGLVGAACGQQETTTREVRLESVSSPGSNPFTSPVGQDQADLTPPQGVGGEVSGDTSGLFGGTGETPPCDAQQLVTELEADEAKARAWGEVLGVQVGDIPRFVESLNPVVLRADTSVTSHGYDDGRYVPYPAVLQAGTAVFVDGFGQPTVKCFNGNPLTKGDPRPQGGFAGQRWAHFQPEGVTSVQPSGNVIGSFSMVDVNTGKPTTAPGGPNPGRVPPWLAALGKEAWDRYAKAQLDAQDARKKADGAKGTAAESQQAADRARAARDSSFREWQRLVALFGPNDPRTQAARNDFITRDGQFRNAQSKANNDKGVAAVLGDDATRREKAAEQERKRAEQINAQITDCRNGKPTCSPTPPAPKPTPKPAPTPTPQPRPGERQKSTETTEQGDQTTAPEQRPTQTGGGEQERSPQVPEQPEQPEPEQPDTGGGAPTGGG
ncbi:hypothetical protein GCM10011581_34020 [Saccharopolyspora subtropica]|uniref:DUF6777 domain-containing protein n=1 Tax=Saccharopolyspora thermophila TaxID=89367 RepID=A0A917K1V9_9PSEU|nr:DUF6777 domain-containing protein [Saccharopolyspora subtropica]GGI94104.1 hypothetical protein GCM10011581_34020 [Saccharopolyspora subtropica]